MMAQKPLLLKEYLELDSDSDSDSSTSFASLPRQPESFTTVRFLLEAERCPRLIRSRSKGALTKLAAVLDALRNFRLSSPTRPRPNGSGFLSKSISKKFSKKFWKKSNYEDQKVTVKDIVRLNSFELCGETRSNLYLTSPVVSSCSSCAEGEEESESLPSSSGGSSTDCFVDAARNSPPPPPPPPKSPTPTGRQPFSEEVEVQGTECSGCCQTEEEKERLSPVSVMDFPYDDEGDEYAEDEAEDEEDDDDEGSHCFEQSLANIERTTHQLLEKIRRFETLAELEPLDLELRFASLEDDDDKFSDEDHVAPPEKITAWELTRQLRTNCQVCPHSQKFLVDFFIEGLSCSASATSGDVEGLLSAARVWIKGGGCLRPEEHAKAQLISEMERNGRWRCFEDGKDDVAADVEGGVFGSLLQELVLDLVVC